VENDSDIEKHNQSQDQDLNLDFQITEQEWWVSPDKITVSCPCFNEVQLCENMWGSGVVTPCILVLGSG